MHARTNAAAAALAFAMFAISPLAAQDAAAPLPVQHVNAVPTGNAVLPANTEVLLQMSQDVTTKGKTWEEGDTFKLTVVKPVMLGDYVIIPEGSPAYGRITWLTSKGAFGKSGKMDVELEHVEVGGRKIRLDGTFRQEGEGNTLATAGGVILAGVFAGFVTGQSALSPEGRELMATTEGDIQLAIPASAVHREVKQAGLAPVGETVAIAATTDVAVTPTAEAPDANVAEPESE
ncbi:MAG: hypothetical protein K5799_03960 [Erythrobacter sp.]|nr:hypothetical protein [Erythrobacter sp.]